MSNLKHSPIYVDMVRLVQDQQQHIITELESIDGHQFLRDNWTRPGHGYGITCVLEDGNVFEKAAVNISVVNGTMHGQAVSHMRSNHASIKNEIQSLDYSATGLSLIVHPKNPMAPTVHMNCRFLETFNSDGSLSACWFGGGIDLTPCYIFEEDALHFHSSIKSVCDTHSPDFYYRFKRWCDEYFWNSHRNESRGIGGIFFDDLEGLGPGTNLQAVFLFVSELTSNFPRIYLPIVCRRKDQPYTEAQKEWQQIRRGRYVEFNLLHDRGTKFGLNASTPRVESILISLPLTASWRYQHEPKKGSKEKELIDLLQSPKAWV